MHMYIQHVLRIFLLMQQDLESAISGFTAEARKDPNEKTFKNLTYEDVYWASKIENPLVRVTH